MRSRSFRGRALRRLPRVVVLGALVATLSAAPAAAQSLFETLFGPSKPSHAYPQVQPYRSVLPMPPAHRPSATAGSGGASNYSLASRDHDDGAGSGSYRTVCVRMCDGYYWPISHNVSRGRMNRDAGTCRSSCGEEARLFYMPARTSTIDDAVDLQGRPYGKIPNAFLYRKRLVDGCACRPAPWSDIEAARHNQYLMAELAARPRRDGADDAPPLGPRLSARSAQDIGVGAPITAVAAAEAPPATAPAVVAGTSTGADTPAARVLTPPLVERPAAITLADAAETRSQPPSAPTPRRTRASRQDGAPIQPQFINRKPPAAPAPIQTVQAKPPVAPGVFSALGGPQKYTWPGDPVRR